MDGYVAHVSRFRSGMGMTSSHRRALILAPLLLDALMRHAQGRDLALWERSGLCETFGETVFHVFPSILERILFAF